ncbi:unnamed protein product [Lymnaea stagnalis]|uniref:Carboxylic ester hydrolase n=1 Tax=Lymnaea stagnalis TaxID=6523 RepID=A0AAV2I7A8_LYMST
MQPVFMIDPNIKSAEDCLVLNVYVNEIRQERARFQKVLFWIHGGGFILGSSYGHDAGTLLTDHDVIVVTINYRLGVLGFLSTENEAGPGNYGLWDQVLALKWVKDNIAAFGGDPDDITVAGQSAGGSAASLLALTPHGKGLFTKVYSHSGTATSLFAKYINAKNDVLALAKQVSCWDGDITDEINLAQSGQILECLRTKPADQIAQGPTFKLSRANFVPRVDGDFLPTSPLDLLQNDQYLDSIEFYQKAYLVSYNNNEQQGTDVLYGMFKTLCFSNDSLTTEEKVNLWSQTVDAATAENIGDRLGIDTPPRALVDFVHDWYERRKGRDSALPVLMSDVSFTIPSYDLLNALARSRSTDAWSLYFNHYPGFMRGAFKGMIHGMDLVYLLDLSLGAMASLTGAGIEGKFTEEDVELRTLYQAVVAEFIKTGSPVKPLLAKLPGGWPTYDLHGAKYLDFNPSPSVQRNLNREKRELWEKTIPRLATLYQRTTQHTEL